MLYFAPLPERCSGICLTLVMKETLWSKPFAFLSLLFLLASCGQTNESPAIGVSRLERMRGDFLFTVSQESDLVHGLIRFSLSANGLGRSLGEAQLLLDETELRADSTEMNGVFYEAELPAEHFFADHSLTIREGNEANTEVFSVPRFSLISELPASLPANDLEFRLEGVEDGESVILMIVDTSFANNDLNRKYTVMGKKLFIPGADLDILSKGPVSMEILFEKKIRTVRLPLKSGTITVRQSERREFILGPAIR